MSSLKLVRAIYISQQSKMNKEGVNTTRNFYIVGAPKLRELRLCRSDVNSDDSRIKLIDSASH